MTALDSLLVSLTVVIGYESRTNLGLLSGSASATSCREVYTSSSACLISSVFFSIESASLHASATPGLARARNLRSPGMLRTDDGLRIFCS